MADFMAVKGEFSGHPHVLVEPVGAHPPETYRVTYRIKGLRLEGDQPVPVDEHRCEIRLPLGYPRQQPYVVPLTEVFHPNIAAHYCIGDYWSAGQPLTDIIYKMGDMLQYRLFNVKSPLNAAAAVWVSENPSLFPIDTVQLGVPDVEVNTSGRAASVAAPDAGASDRDRAPAGAVVGETSPPPVAPRRRLEIEL